MLADVACHNAATNMLVGYAVGQTRHTRAVTDPWVFDPHPTHSLLGSRFRAIPVLGRVPTNPQCLILAIVVQGRDLPATLIVPAQPHSDYATRASLWTDDRLLTVASIYLHI